MPEASALRPRWLRRLGIRAQLLALLLPGMAVLLAIDSWTDYHAYSATLSEAYDQVLQERVFALDDQLGLDPAGAIAFKQPFALQSLLEASRGTQAFLHVGWVPLDAQGAPTGVEHDLLGVPGQPVTPGAPPAATRVDARGRAIVFHEALQAGQPVRVATLTRRMADGQGRLHEVRIRAAEGTERREQARHDLLLRELLATLRMLGTMVLCVWIGLAWILKPLERLREVLRQRHPHELAPLDARQVPEEVSPLVEAVNHHIADHRALLAQQAEFLADASHQLRTPLAIMMTQAGYALREQDPQRTRETLHAIVDQLRRSRRLSDQLLALAHASRTGEGDQAPVVDLNQVARDVVLQYLALAHEKDQDLGWRDARGDDAPEGEAPAPVVPVRAEAPELHELLANLLHNAIRHVPRGGRITVSAGTRGMLAVAEVRDDGPGIPADRHEAVFRRFQRDGTASTEPGPGDARGAGLGLAIARAYARRHGGEVVLSAGEPRAQGGFGLCAALHLPLADVSPQHQE